MLSNFQLGDQALLQSFLIGQPELREMMQSPQMQQLRQRVIASYHLGPLDKAETQRLHRAPAEARRLEGRSAVRAGVLRPHPRGDRRHSAADQHAVQPPAARRATLPRSTCSTPSDVQAIAREIRDELGPEAALTHVAVVGGTGGAEGQLTTRDGRRRHAQALRSPRGADRPPRADRRPRRSTCCIGCCIRNARRSPERRRGS